VTHSRSTTNPTGGAEPRREVAQPALDTHRMERVVEPANMQRAWRQVRANQGAPGIDRMTLEEGEDWLYAHGPTGREAHGRSECRGAHGGARTAETLLTGTYQPLPLRRRAIPKPGGRGERLLGIRTPGRGECRAAQEGRERPAVIDRMIQQAIAQVLTPIFDPEFSESSFGFRPKRSAHGALRQVQAYGAQGYRIAVDLDLEKFFDNVQHDVLMVRVARKVADPRVLALIGRYLRAGVMVDGVVQPTEQGTPQGGPLSPLLSNILLDDLDQELERRDLRFARYADDLIILVRTQRAGERVKASITRYLTGVLRLSVNEQKSRVAPISQCVFLSF